MKTLKNSFITLIIVFLMISCSTEKTYDIETKGNLTIIKNKNVPAESRFTLNFVEETTIPLSKGNNYPVFNSAGITSICGDDEGNYYIADYQSSKISKFSKNFEFITSFGGRGNGPGEFAAGPVTVSYSNGRILASCINRENVIAFKTNGEFIQNLPDNIRCSFSHSQVGFNNNVIMNQVTRRFDGGDRVISSAVNVLDPELIRIEKTLYTHEARTGDGVLHLKDMNMRFAAGKDYLYIGDVSTDRYTVFVYNKDFDKVMEIRKSYTPKVEGDPDAEVYLFWQNTLGGTLPQKINTPWGINKIFYHKSIYRMMVDNKERLWVVTPEKNINSYSGLYVDVFDNGIFLNTVRLPFFKGNNFSGVWIPVFLVNDKLLYVDKEDEVIRVYSY